MKGYEREQTYVAEVLRVGRTPSGAEMYYWEPVAANTDTAEAVASARIVLRRVNGHADDAMRVRVYVGTDESERVEPPDPPAKR